MWPKDIVDNTILALEHECHGAERLCGYCPDWTLLRAGERTQTASRSRRSTGERRPGPLPTPASATVVPGSWSSPVRRSSRTTSASRSARRSRAAWTSSSPRNC
jgi:hypothetical protein